MAHYQLVNSFVERSLFFNILPFSWGVNDVFNLYPPCFPADLI